MELFGILKNQTFLGSTGFIAVTGATISLLTGSGIGLVRVGGKH